jgi:uncharacterized phage protein (TIGR02218 family)
VTFSTLETSVYDGRPDEFYRFTQDTTSWLYTSSEQALSHPTWGTATPAAIRRNAPSMAKETRASTLTLDVDPALSIVGLFASGSPNQPVWLTVARMHRGDTDPMTFWTGQVRGLVRRGARCELSCEPADKILHRSPLRLTFGSQCPLRLYGTRCGVSAASYTHAATLTDVDGTDVQATEFGLHPDGYFTGGELLWGNTSTLVAAHIGNTLTLWQEIEGLTAGASVSVLEGCNHLWKKADGSDGDCIAKFNNSENYGGFPWIPDNRNPFVRLEG